VAFATSSIQLNCGDEAEGEVPAGEAALSFGFFAVSGWPTGELLLLTVSHFYYDTATGNAMGYYSIVYFDFPQGCWGSLISQGEELKSGMHIRGVSSAGEKKRH